MNGFEFNAYCGNDVETVEVSQPHGGGDSWHVYINRRYQGRISYIRNEWVNLDRGLETPDFDALVERLEEYLKHKKSPD